MKGTNFVSPWLQRTITKESEQGIRFLADVFCLFPIAAFSEIDVPPLCAIENGRQSCRWLNSFTKHRCELRWSAVYSISVYSYPSLLLHLLEGSIALHLLHFSKLIHFLSRQHLFPDRPFKFPSKKTRKKFQAFEAEFETTKTEFQQPKRDQNFGSRLKFSGPISAAR